MNSDRSKKDVSAEKIPLTFLEKVSDTLRVFSHPLRLRIAESLDKREELKVGDIASVCDESQPVVSQHLSQMRRVGIVASRRDGTQVFYRLANDSSRSILNYVKENYRESSGSPPTNDPEA